MLRHPGLSLLLLLTGKLPNALLDNQNGRAVLNIRHNLKGMTLVEILVALAIVVILFAAAAPNFSDWIQNTKVHTSAESILNGITIAKNEAVHRNTTSQFVSCGGTSWDVVAASAAASAVVCSSSTAAPSWENVQSRSGQDGSSNTLIDPANVSVSFNGLGRQASTANLFTGSAVAATNFDINIGTNGLSCFCPAGSCGYPISIPSLKHQQTALLTHLNIVRWTDTHVRPGTSRRYSPRMLTMKTQPKLANSQKGVMLLEALIAILIFSMGILAIVGLQASSIKLASDAKYRSDASLLANRLIGQMWLANSAAEFLRQVSTTGGTSYAAWAASVASSIPTCRCFQSCCHDHSVQHLWCDPCKRHVKQQCLDRCLLGGSR